MNVYRRFIHWFEPRRARAWAFIWHRVLRHASEPQGPLPQNVRPNSPEAGRVVSWYKPKD